MERSEAIDQRLERYTTGRPCKSGHFSPRYTISGVCLACNVGHAKAHTKRIVERFSKGLVRLELMVHPGDMATLRMLADTLAAARPNLPSGREPDAVASMDEFARAEREELIGRINTNLGISK